MIWMAVRGIVVWAVQLLWLEYNDIVFNDIRWPRENILQKVWLGLDCGCLSWENVKSTHKDKFEGIWWKASMEAQGTFQWH